MSHPSTRLRRLGLAGLATLASLAAAPSAGATAYTLNAQCKLPVISERPLTLGIEVPATASPADSVVPLKVTSLSGSALDVIVEEARITATLKASVALPSGGSAPSEVKARYPLTTPANATPVSLVGESGEATVVYTGLTIEWTTFDSEGGERVITNPCTLPVGNLNYPKIQIGDEGSLAPSPPGPVTVKRESSTSLAVAWGASTGNVASYRVYFDGVITATVAAPRTSARVSGLLPSSSPVEIGVAAVGANGLSTRPTTVMFQEITIDPYGVPVDLRSTLAPTSVTLSWNIYPGFEPPSYEVFQDDVLVKTLSGARTTTVTGLTPGKTYKFAVGSRNGSLQLGVSPPITVTLPPLPSSSYAWDLKGSASIKTLIKGSVPLKGGLAVDIDDAGVVTGDLVLQEASARLTALSFLPLTAKIAFVASGPTTGTYAADVLKTTSKVRIKVTQAKLFGAIPVVTGNTCQTRKLSDINLTSGAGFSLQEGGSLSGQFALSDLNGCGSLNGLISPLTSGAGNTITLQATVPPTPRAG